MKIKEYKKLKANIYEITLDNDEVISLYDDIILKHELLINKELTSNRLTEIIKENDNLESYYKALKYISRKMRSSLEVEKYLAKDYNVEIINNTINKLIKDKYIDDQKYSVSYINDQFNLTNNGPIKIKNNLLKLGIKEEDINIDKDFTNKIISLIEKKIRYNHKLSTNALKTNIINYLINLGYSKDMFIDKLDIIKSNDSSLIEKDYDKLFNKYQNKYDNSKLKLTIKNKLYQKGYEINLINDIINQKESL